MATNDGNKWRPYSSKPDDSSVIRLAQEAAVASMNRLTDAPTATGGQNNYWEPTSALGAAWCKSGSKWKWHSNLDVDEILRQMEEEEDEEIDKAGMEELNSILRRKAQVVEVAASQYFHRPEITVSSNVETWGKDEDEGSDQVLSKAHPPAEKKPRFNFGIFSGATASGNAGISKPVTAAVSSSGGNRNMDAGRTPTQFSNSLWKITSKFDSPPPNLDHRSKESSHSGGLLGVKSNGLGDLRQRNTPDTFGTFRTAGQQLAANYYGAAATTQRTLGVTRPPSALQNAFKPPILEPAPKSPVTVSSTGEEVMDERLKNVDPKMVELIRSEIMDNGSSTDWSDIAGLEFVKEVIKEIIVFPMLRPDIFRGLKAPPKGILLFGPPGTGKTLIGKCIASRSKSTFFAISASSLTSKWVGDGEKMVRALFAVARVHQPSVVFIDEIDSLLSARSDSEHESSRRLKTEFLVQLDGATTEGDERVLVIGATNRPQDLDEAARRRLVKRLYVPLPEAEARLQIIENLMREEKSSLSDAEKALIVTRTQGYSGADMANLCGNAAMGPIRGLGCEVIENISQDDIRPIGVNDFISALRQVKASVSNQDLNLYADWDTKFGCCK